MATGIMGVKDRVLLMVTAMKTRNRHIGHNCLVRMRRSVRIGDAPARTGLRPVAPNGARTASCPHRLRLPISFGDLIQVNVFDNPDLSGQLRVDSKGSIELPLGGTIKVNGLTAAEAGAVIAARLKDAGIYLILTSPFSSLNINRRE